MIKDEVVDSLASIPDPKWMPIPLTRVKAKAD